MAKKNKRDEAEAKKVLTHRLHPDTKKSVWALVFFGIAVLLTLAGFGKAGPVGETIYAALQALFGVGYFVLPLSLLLIASIFVVSERQKVVGVTLVGTAILLLSALGLIEIFAQGRGGWLGLILGALQIPFGRTAAALLNIIIFIIGGLIAANIPIKVRRSEKPAEAPLVIHEPAAHEKPVEKKPEESEPEERETEGEETPTAMKKVPAQSRGASPKETRAAKGYTFPPLSLLRSGSDKPTTGDLRANANVIKRTLESFGISVEMGEINIGPKVTRYTLKPAEGMKLSRITALHQDLALALAAHPIRIEAPIPGKSLVGIEVPNKAAALVRLGSLMNYKEFQSSGLLSFALGRDVTGEPLFTDIEKMPHLLIAGSTGSGKSVMIHSLLVSLLYKNSPATLRLILIDPKRVELSIYEGLPHLVSPVITESKKAMGVFRWAIEEMERRYDVLLGAGSRDIKSYNANGGKEKPLPYLLIVIDELADLMTAYGRDVEGSVVRLAQMARATGLHLVFSTQRPSVEIITGLIKANITSRIALQVASQVDSRTILDAAGAEKLLGGGDLLFVSGELSKPKRIQGAYVTEEEIHAVADFIRDHNEATWEGPEGALYPPSEAFSERGGAFDEYLEDAEDPLYDEAVRVVKEAKKASASLLQRRLKVGYARAARLLDLMEDHGLIGPGEGAKPREVFGEKTEGRRWE